jgi:hypothetical protein
MALWTDVIDPATLTGYARAALADYEARKGTLAQWLPNQTVSDVVVRFVAGSTGLVEEAKFRAYDAEPEIGKSNLGKRVTLELPALGQNIPVSEYQQLRTRNASDDAVLLNIQKTTVQVVQAVADRIERLRGVVLNTGKATIDQDNFKSDDDFGRPAGHTVTAGSLWTTSSVDRLADLTAWNDVYIGTNGEAAGALVMSTRAFRALASGDQFKTVLAGGASRPASKSDIDAILAGMGLPPIYLFDRRVQSGGVSTKVLADDRILMLPAPVAADDASGTQLGGTFWGQTLTSTDLNWGIEDSEQPGIVAGVYRNEKPPVIAEVISDAIALPVLANASLSFSAKVL